MFAACAMFTGTAVAQTEQQPATEADCAAAIEAANQAITT